MIERVSTKTPFREGRKCCERPTDVVCRSSLVSGQAELTVGLNGSSPLSDTKVFAFAKIRVVPRSVLRLRPYGTGTFYYFVTILQKGGIT